MAALAILCFLILLLADISVAETTSSRKKNINDDKDNLACRSNSTHIAWTVSSRDNQKHQYTPSGQSFRMSSALERRRTRTATVATDSCRWQTKEEASQELYTYLRHHVMEFDLPFLETLGFDEEGASGDLPDGLGDGMVGKTIELALQTKIDFPYADELPYEIFCEFVLNYANTNEARSNWRPLFWQKLRPLVNETDTIGSVVRTLNTDMWQILAPSYEDRIYFKSGSTPLIFDPMSILAFGYASCTGLAILFINALRTLGIPARIAGTAEWYKDRSKGNHNWVEVWRDGAWYFLEPSASANPESVDNLDRPPCQRWFCTKDRFSGNPHNSTKVYAARLESVQSIYYPLAWEWNNHDVPGEDVTDFYLERCGQC